MLHKYKTLIAILLWISVWFIVFFPTKTITIDEFHYVGNAYHLVQGDLRQVCDSNYPGQFQNGDFCISKYNIGASIFFWPAATLNQPRLAIVIDFLAVVLSVIVFSQLLRLFQVSQKFLLLFACYPAVIYYSRTAFSEPISMLLVLIAALLLTKLTLEQSMTKVRKSLVNVALGIVIGLAILVRYTNIILFGVMLGLWVLIQAKKYGLSEAFKSLLTTIVGGSPFAILFLWINSYLYGNPLLSGYHFSGEDGIVLSNLIKFLPGYIFALLLMWPGMIVLSKFKVGGQKQKVGVLNIFWWSGVLLILFYSISVNTLFEGRLLDLVLGIRFLLPIIPLFILSYASVLQHWANKRKVLRVVVNVCLLATLVFVPIISYVHQDFLNTTKTEWSNLQQIFIQSRGGGV